MVLPFSMDEATAEPSRHQPSSPLLLLLLPLLLLLLLPLLLLLLLAAGTQMASRPDGCAVRMAKKGKNERRKEEDG